MFGFFRRKPYSIKLRGRDCFDYREGERTVSIYREWLHGVPYDMAVHFDNVHGWDSPADAPAWNADDRERIKKNITEAFKRCRIMWQ